MEKPVKLTNKNFMLLWQGQFVSKLGTHIYLIAMVWWMKNAFESATLIGLLWTSAAVPVVLFSAIGGVFADRYSRRNIIIFSDLINGLATLSLAAVMFTAPEATILIAVWLFSITILASTVNSFFGPAISASIPDLVPEEKLSAANSMSQFAEQVSLFLGQGIGSTLFKILGAPLVVLIDGISYLFSAISELFIKIPQVFPEKEKDLKGQYQSFKNDLWEGIVYIKENTGLKMLLFVSIFINFFTMPVIVLLPFYVDNFLKVSVDWYSFFLASHGIGILFGYISVGIFNLHGKLRSKMFIIFTIIESGGYGILGLVTSAPLAVFLAFIGGMFNGFIMVTIITILQLSTPSTIRGRVFGVLTTISGSIAPLGMLIGGVAGDLTGQNIPLIYMICGVIMTVLSILISFSGHYRKFLAFEPKTKLDPEGFTYKIKIWGHDEATYIDINK